MHGSGEERCGRVKCEPLRRRRDDWWDQSVKGGMKDELSMCSSLAEDRIGSELLSMARRSNGHFAVENHTGRGGRSIVCRKLARWIV